jgi:tetratricopeptide (TPR) repeat protein
MFLTMKPWAAKAFALMIFGCLTAWVVGGCEATGRDGARQGGGDAGAELAELQRAERLKREGMLDAAIVAFEQVLAQNPREITAHIGLGDIHEARGNYQAASQRYEVAKRIDPSNFKATYKLGLMKHLLDKVAEAVDEYLQALAIQPDSFQANLNVATAYLQLGKPKLGLPYARKAIQLRPGSQTAHANLGALLAATGDYQAAVEQYRTAAELGPISSELALNMAEALTRAGRYQRAVNTLRMLTQGPGVDNAEVFERLGYAYFKLRQYDRSLKAYNRALELEPEYVKALNGKGVNLMTMYLAGGREDDSLKSRAIRAWQKSVRVDGDQRRIIDLIARYRKL